ncbi:hypothetical protein ACB092_09G002000 [Castanea dentata]
MVKMNLYAVIRYKNQECWSNMAQGVHIIAREENKLVWNEKFTFNAMYPGSEDHKYELTFHIMDKHNLSDEMRKVELRQGKYRVVLPDRTYVGEICVVVNFTLNV